jgi:drug/metabolite transporter (DMT)-like permease
LEKVSSRQHVYEYHAGLFIFKGLKHFMAFKNTPSSSSKSSFDHTASMHVPHAQTQGILFMLATITALSLMDAVAKELGAYVHTTQILWARYAGQLAILLVMFGPRLTKYVKTKQYRLQILRSFMQLTAAACFFIALKTNGLSESTAVADLAPVLITLTAAFVLGERVGLRRGIGVACALIGALIVLRPGADVFSMTSLWPIGTAVSLTVFAIATRYMGPSESVITALLYTAVVCTVIMSLVLPTYWVPLTPYTCLLLALVGALGTFAQVMMIKAYTSADASVIAPFSYAGLLTATLWGYLFFGDIPDFWTCVGALVIVSAGLYVWSRERQLTIKASAPKNDCKKTDTL